MKGRIIWFYLMVAFLCQGAPASALTYDLNTPFTAAGTGPVLEPAWLTATFDDVAGGVQLKLTAAGLPSGSYVTQWYFNIFQNTEIAQPQQLGQITDPRASFLLSPDNLYAGTPEDTLGQGFDFSMTFPSAGDNLFTSQATAAFLFTDPTGIIAAWFNQLNTAGNFYAAANVLSLSGAGSSIAATSATTPGPGPGPAPVPEPATMILLSCGMACLTFFGRRKFLA